MSVSITSGGFNMFIDSWCFVKCSFQTLNSGKNHLSRSENFKVNYVVVITGCFSLPLFTNKKDKKSSASVHVTSKLSMVKTKFSGILLKSIADIIWPFSLRSKLVSREVKKYWTKQKCLWQILGERKRRSRLFSRHAWGW